MLLAMQSAPVPASLAQRAILRAFPFFAELAFQDVWQTTLDKRPKHAVRFAEEFERVFSQLEVPLRKVGGEEGRVDLKRDLWVVPVNQARLFLRRAFSVAAPREKKDAKPFRLLDLPAELRERIFELVVALPKSSVRARHSFNDQRPITLSARTRSYDLLLDMTIPDQEYGLSCMLPSRLLAFLRTNQQIYSEAQHVFYSVNTFSCEDQKDLFYFLQALPAEKRRHLRHVTFEFKAELPKYWREMGVSAMEMLKQCDFLREIDVKINEQAWLGFRAKSSNKQIFANVLKIPGMKELGSLRGLKRVGWHGHCEELKKLFGEIMLKSEVETTKGKKAAGTKRKAEVGEKKGKRAKV